MKGATTSNKQGKGATTTSNKQGKGATTTSNKQGKGATTASSKQGKRALYNICNIYIYYTGRGRRRVRGIIGRRSNKQRHKQ